MARRFFSLTMQTAKAQQPARLKLAEFKAARSLD